MEKPSSSRSVSVSCGDCLKLKLPWTTATSTKKRNNNNNKKSRYIKHRGSASICDATASFCPQVTKQQRPGRVGVFKYDALSYAQNFDDGAFDGEDDQEYFSHGFSSRYAAPASKSLCSSTSTG